MWILEISIKGREILRHPVAGRSLLIGRSPSCDIVLRSPGVKPVHFLLEWIGEGAPVPGEADWSLSDIHRQDADGLDVTSTDESGMGVALTKEPVTLAGYEFRWVFDNLAETHLQRGVLSEKLRQTSEGEVEASSFFSDSQILEVVTVDSVRNQVTDIQHFKLAPFAKTYNRLPLAPPILFHTPMEARAHVDLNLVPDVKAYLRGYLIRVDDLKNTMLGPNDLLQVRWQMQDYYLRLVPEVKAPETPVQFWKEPFYIACATSLFALALLIGLVSAFSSPEELKEVVPPRIAQVSVRELPLPPVAPPEPALLPAPTPEPMPPANAQLNVPEARPRAVEAVAPTRKTPKTTLPAPKAQVTSMGLLGNLKASKDAPRVRADRVLNQGLSSDTAGGDDGFVVKQPAQGQLDRRNRAGSDELLAAASSEVNVGNKADVNSLGGIRADEELPPEARRLGARSEAARGDSVAGGGLTREVVRNSIRLHQREVRSCYEKALLVKPKITGRIFFQWVITPAGRTTALKMQRSQVGTPSLEKCVAGVLASINWPRARNGQSTTVNYPFEFKTGN